MPQIRGRRRGDSQTRQLISTAARQQFAQRGYDRTTIRSVAEEAGVDPALVIHFFGSKHRLFGEAVAIPVDNSPLMTSIAEAPVETYGELVARFVVGIMKSKQYGEAFAGLLRAAASEPQAADLLRERLKVGVIAPLVRSLNVDRAELRANLVVSQTVGLVVTRSLLQLDALAALTDDEIVAHVGPTIQRYLTAPL